MGVTWVSVTLTDFVTLTIWYPDSELRASWLQSSWVRPRVPVREGGADVMLGTCWGAACIPAGVLTAPRGLVTRAAGSSGRPVLRRRGGEGRGWTPLLD